MAVNIAKEKIQLCIQKIDNRLSALNFRKTKLQTSISEINNVYLNNDTKISPILTRLTSQLKHINQRITEKNAEKTKCQNNYNRTHSSSVKTKLDFVGAKGIDINSLFSKGTIKQSFIDKITSIENNNSLSEETKNTIIQNIISIYNPDNY